MLNHTSDKNLVVDYTTIKTGKDLNFEGIINEGIIKEEIYYYEINISDPEKDEEFNNSLLPFNLLLNLNLSELDFSNKKMKFKIEKNNYSFLKDMIYFINNNRSKGFDLSYKKLNIDKKLIYELRLNYFQIKKLDMSVFNFFEEVNFFTVDINYESIKDFIPGYPDIEDRNFIDLFKLSSE